MKKIYSLISLLFPLFVTAQSIIIEDADGNDVSSTTIEINSNDLSVYDMKVDLYVKNTSSTKTILAKRTENMYVANSLEYFCWFQCYPPTETGSNPIWEDLTGVELEENQKHLLSSHVLPDEKQGSWKYTFIVYDKNNTNDSAFVNIEYRLEEAVGLSSINENDFTADVFPNPAVNELTIIYNTNKNYLVNKQTIVVRNLLGETVKVVALDKNSTSQVIDIKDLNSGVYFYSYLINNKTKLTERLVVK